MLDKTSGGLPGSPTGELKFYLQQRALSTSGTHSDLAARALVAFEQDMPIKVTAENLASSLKSDYENTLRNGGLIIDPLLLNCR